MSAAVERVEKARIDFAGKGIADNAFVGIDRRGAPFECVSLRLSVTLDTNVHELEAIVGSAVEVS